MTVADLPGVPESLLPTQILAALPATTPSAPWRCRVVATVWWHRAASGAADLLPDGVRPGPPFAVGALLRYESSPVGPYSEVLACPHLAAGALGRGALAHVSVPFIAVDSMLSIAGGRVHWALPKVLAAFENSVLATGDGWHVGANARSRGPRFPVVGRLADTQADGQGRLTTSISRLRGSGRAAAVDVTASDGLASWLLPGTHPGLVLRGGLFVGVAR